MKTEIPSSKIKIGMFVSELDRSWVSTPFLFQGFLIKNNKQIEQLREYCKFVVIDWDRSTQGLQTAKSVSTGKVEPDKLDPITPSASLNDAAESTIQTSIADHPAPESIKEKPADVQAPVTLNAKDAVFEPTELGHSTLPDTTQQNINKYLHTTPETQLRAGLLASLSGQIKDFFKDKSPF